MFANSAIVVFGTLSVKVELIYFKHWHTGVQERDSIMSVKIWIGRYVPCVTVWHPLGHICQSIPHGM